MTTPSATPLVSEVRDRLLGSAEVINSLGVRKLSVFGSVLHGRDTEGSDLDLLVEFAPGCTPGLAFFEIQEKLGEILGREVDLNTPAFLSRFFRSAVLEEAELVYERS